MKDEMDKIPVAVLIDADDISPALAGDVFRQACTIVDAVHAAFDADKSAVIAAFDAAGALLAKSTAVFFSDSRRNYFLNIPMATEVPVRFLEPADDVQPRLVGQSLQNIYCLRVVHAFSCRTAKRVDYSASSAKSDTVAARPVTGTDKSPRAKLREFR